MKTTNLHALPDPLVEAVMQDNYNKGFSHYSTTGLLRPPRLAALEKKHWDELSEDVTDRLWRFSGHVKQVVWERAAKANPERYIVTQRYFAKVKSFILSGEIDLYDKSDCTLYDWKETSVWKSIVGDQNEWIQQANINAWLLQAYSIPVKAIKYIAFFKDWKRREANNPDKPDYPKIPAQVFNLPIWSEQQTYDFICERIRLHEEAKKVLPECTPEERWQKLPQYARRKIGNKRAIKLYDTRVAAEAELEKGQEVEARLGENVRCDAYCPVSEKCEQLQKMRAANEFVG